MEKEYKILAVDDDLVNLEIMEEILADTYEFETAQSGEQAIEMMESFQPDVILLDIMMPGIDGYETCHQMRMNPAFQDTAIIMVSAKGMVTDQCKAHEVGAYDYITKPFAEEELLDSIEFFLKLDVGC